MQAKQPIAENQRWGRLTYIREIPKDRPNSRPVLVECDCGVTRVVELYNLVAGLTSSCNSIKCLNQYKDALKREIEAMEDSLVSKEFSHSNMLMRIAKMERKLISGESTNFEEMWLLTNEFLKR